MSDDEFVSRRDEIATTVAASIMARIADFSPPEGREALKTSIHDIIAASLLGIGYEFKDEQI